MFIPVDWAALTIYLERLNEETNKWITVETFEKEFTPADAEDGELTHVILSIDVGTQPAGHYYRLRCIHENTTTAGTKPNLPKQKVSY